MTILGRDLHSDLECNVCRKNVRDCQCPDLRERLRGATGDHVAFRWCSRCDHHFAKCECGDPVWIVLGGPPGFPLPEEG